MNPVIVLENDVYYHAHFVNPSYGEKVRITLDSNNLLTIYRLSDQQQPQEIIAQVALSNECLLGGGDASLAITTQGKTYLLDFYPRTQLPSFAVFMTMYSRRFKAVVPAYNAWREAIIRAGVRVEKHRVWGSVFVGVALAVGMLVVLFVSVILITK